LNTLFMPLGCTSFLSSVPMIHNFDLLVPEVLYVLFIL
jgi:hypothetical protein